MVELDELWKAGVLGKTVGDWALPVLSVSVRVYDWRGCSARLESLRIGNCVW